MQAWRFQLALAVASQVGDGQSSLEQKAGEAGASEDMFICILRSRLLYYIHTSIYNIGYFQPIIAGYSQVWGTV